MAKTILITGASSGIGEETARALLAAGHIVYAGARSVERMNPLLEAGARALTLDVNDGGSMTTAVQTIVRARGRIVNISPVGGKPGEPFGSWYHATKFAVEGLSDSLRMELRQFGIDVVIIQPDAIISEWNGIARQQLKTRYATGGGAKLALFLHRVLPDRAFDAMMLMGARPQTEVAV